MERPLTLTRAVSNRTLHGYNTEPRPSVEGKCPFWGRFDSDASQKADLWRVIQFEIKRRKYNDSPQWERHFKFPATNYEVWGIIVAFGAWRHTYTLIMYM